MSCPFILTESRLVGLVQPASRLLLLVCNNLGKLYVQQWFDLGWSSEHDLRHGKLETTPLLVNHIHIPRADTNSIVLALKRHGSGQVCIPASEDYSQCNLSQRILLNKPLDKWYLLCVYLFSNSSGKSGL